MDATRPSLLRLAAGGAAIALLGALAAGWLALARTGASRAVDVAVDIGAEATAPARASGVAPAGGASGWAAWGTATDGRPLRWDPCRPVTFVLGAGPPGAAEEVGTALAMLAGATGLDLRIVGTTDERPSAARPLVVRTEDGWAWAPVLVAWAEPGEGGLLGPHDRGVAVPVAVRDGARHALVTGQVVLNADRTDLRPGFGDRADARGATLLHELAHVLGLAHVDDPAQLMSAEPGRGPVAFGTGDLAGLAAVGADAGCLDTPDPVRGLSPAAG